MLLGLARRCSIVSLSLGLLSSLYAEEIKPSPGLPEPLTLDAALSLADSMHPSLESARAELDLAHARLEKSTADDDVRIQLDLRTRIIDPVPSAPDHSNQDHSATLWLEKRLYDFGAQDAADQAAEFDLKGQEQRLISATQQHRIEIVKRFYEAVLADLQFYRYNEEMSVVYIALDRLRIRRDLKQVSDLDVLEADTAYQKIRHLRYKSLNDQRQTRARLADALNTPETLPATLVPPTLGLHKAIIPEYEELLKVAFDKNPALLAARAQVQAAEARVEAARHKFGPVLKADADVNAYTRPIGSRENWGIGLKLEVPLYVGRRSDAETAQSLADLHKLQAQARNTENMLREAVLERWLELDGLQSKRKQMESIRDYRELYLDRSRAMYEMEFKADLGDAMTRVSEAAHDMMQTDYQITLAWAELDALLGRKPLVQLPPMNEKSK